MAAVAFLGTGRMGAGMAARLVTAGHDVTVWNRTPGRTAALVDRGARTAGTPREAAAGADAVLVMVSDDEASRSVWLGAEGVLAARTAPDALAIECSTLSQAWVLELADAVRRTGRRYVDSPVTGLPDAAAAGALTLLVGAADDDLEAAQPFLRPLSAEQVHFGPVGAGTAYKLVVNLVGAVQIASVAEAMALSERAGLDLDQVARTIATGQAASPQVVRTSRRMVEGHHDRDVVFSGRLRRKDAAYAVALADALGLGVPFGQVALDGLDRLLGLDLGEQNESAVVEVARRASPPGVAQPHDPAAEGVGLDQPERRAQP